MFRVPAALHPQLREEGSVEIARDRKLAENIFRPYTNCRNLYLQPVSRGQKYGPQENVSGPLKRCGGDRGGEGQVTK